MENKSFVGRQDATEKLKLVLNRASNSGENLVVQSIEGPGGIGKSALFKNALDNSDLSAMKYLTLSTDGNNAQGRNLIEILARMLNNADADAIKKKPAGYYFPDTNDVIKIILEVRNETIALFKKNNPDYEEKKIH